MTDTSQDRVKAITRRWRESIGVCEENRKPILCEDAFGLYVPTQLIADLEWLVEKLERLQVEAKNVTGWLVDAQEKIKKLEAENKELKDEVRKD